MWEVSLKTAHLVHFKTLHLQATCETRNQRQEGSCAFLEHTRFFPGSWMCKKQTAVSHNNAESEMISLDAGVRLDGMPALQLGECVLETLSSKPAKGNLDRPKGERVIPCHSHSDTCVIESTDHVPPNMPNSSHSTELNLFEDNAAVVHMTNNGRSPNLRHVVDVKWLLEIYVDKNTCAPTINWRIFLTKGTFASMQ